MAIHNSPENCVKCSGKCCRYFMLELDTPRSKSDFENIRWYLAHEEIIIYIEKKQWFMLVATPCRFLDAENKCGIYDNRPQICREHDPFDCEFDQAYSADQKFETLEDLDRYIAARFSRKRKTKLVLKKPEQLEPASVNASA